MRLTRKFFKAYHETVEKNRLSFFELTGDQREEYVVVDLLQQYMALHMIVETELL